MLDNLVTESIEPFQIQIVEPKTDVSDPFTVPLNKLQRLVKCLLKESPGRVIFVESVPDKTYYGRYKLDSVNKVPYLIDASDNFKLLTL